MLSLTHLTRNIPQVGLNVPHHQRVLGLAHVPDLEMIPDESARAVCESLVLNAAQSWVMNRYEVKSIYNLVEMIQTAAPNPAVG